MNTLSDADKRTIRHARNAVNLLMRGALEAVLHDYGPDDNPDRSVAQDAVILHIREEVESYYTKHELGDAPTERTSQETSIA